MQIVVFLSGAVFGAAVGVWFMFYLAFKQPRVPTVKEEWEQGGG